MSYSRWGESNWYAYDDGHALVAWFAEGFVYRFSEQYLRNDKAGCVAGILDGNDADKRELEEIIEEYLADQEDDRP